MLRSTNEIKAVKILQAEKQTVEIWKEKKKGRGILGRCGGVFGIKKERVWWMRGVEAYSLCLSRCWYWFCRSVLGLLADSSILPFFLYSPSSLHNSSALRLQVCFPCFCIFFDGDLLILISYCIDWICTLFCFFWFRSGLPSSCFIRIFLFVFP